MTAYALTTDDGSLLNALFEIEHSAIVFYSRGGTKGKDSRNPDYSNALRLLLRRLSDRKMAILSGWVDSNRVQNLPLSAREILGEDDLGAPPDELFKRMTAKMQKVGRAKDVLSVGGNPTKRIRLQLQGDFSSSVIADALKAVPSDIDLRSQQRLPAEVLNKVTPEHVWKAVELLGGGRADHGFGESTDFDLIADDGRRFPPKAVFGIAATEALGFKVLPKHFVGGKHSPCFRILRAAGYAILSKTLRTPQTTALLAPHEQWAEGKPKLVVHVLKERGAGLAAAKKAEFRRLHAKLHCERCGLDPVLAYETEHGEACIEVHHHAKQVHEMNEGHVTKLEDLQCLCANCHRVVHRLLKQSVASTPLPKMSKRTAGTKSTTRKFRGKLRQTK
jgi:5-methylcytosine-specific restriction protein A